MMDTHTKLLPESFMIVETCAENVKKGRRTSKSARNRASSALLEILPGHTSPLYELLPSVESRVRSSPLHLPGRRGIFSVRHFSAPLFARLRSPTPSAQETSIAERRGGRATQRGSSPWMKKALPFHRLVCGGLGSTVSNHRQKRIALFRQRLERVAHAQHTPPLFCSLDEQPDKNAAEWHVDSCQLLRASVQSGDFLSFLPSVRQRGRCSKWRALRHNCENISQITAIPARRRECEEGERKRVVLSKKETHGLNRWVFPRRRFGEEEDGERLTAPSPHHCSMKRKVKFLCDAT